MAQYVESYYFVKRAVIGSKDGWKLGTIFLSCKVIHDWSIIKLGNILYLLDWSLLLLIKFAGVTYKKDPAFWYFFSRIFHSCRVPHFRGQKVAKHGGHQDISFLFID